MFKCCIKDEVSVIYSEEKVTGSHSEPDQLLVPTAIYKNGKFLERKQKRGAAELPSCARRRAGGQRMAGGCHLREPVLWERHPWATLRCSRGVSGWVFSGRLIVLLPFQSRLLVGGRRCYVWRFAAGREKCRLIYLATIAHCFVLFCHAQRGKIYHLSSQKKYNSQISKNQTI